MIDYVKFLSSLCFIKKVFTQHITWLFIFFIVNQIDHASLSGNLGMESRNHGGVVSPRYPDTINILNYGLAGFEVDRTGKTDVSVALSEAVKAANKLLFWSTEHVPQPICIYIPAGRYLIKSPPPAFRGAGCVLGDGPEQTIIILDISFAGDLFQWSESWSVYGTGGARVSNIKINGNLQAFSQQNGLMFYDRNDFVNVADVSLTDIPGRAIGSGIIKNTHTPPQAYLRESRMRAIRVINSGTPSTPAVEFTTQGTNGVDGTNEISISQFDIYGSRGTSLLISNASSKGTGSRSGIVRQMKFDALRIEGTENGTALGDLLQIGDTNVSGPIGHISFTNAELINPYRGAAAIHITSNKSSGSSPSRIYFQGFIGGGNPKGKGVNIESGKNIRIITDQIRSNDTNVTIGSDVSGIYLDGLGEETSWTYEIDQSSLLGVMSPVRYIGDPTSPNGLQSTALTNIRWVRANANGKSLSIPAGTKWFSMTQSNNLQDQIVTLPKGSYDGHIIQISSIGTINHITLISSDGIKISGAPTRISRERNITLGWDENSSKWITLQ